MENSLEIHELGKSFGRNVVFRNMSVAFARGTITGLIGANGSGKTVLLNMMTGLDHPNTGTIAIAGVDITRLAPHRIARLGVARTFQIPSLSPELTVEQHFVLASRLSFGKLIRDALYPPKNRVPTLWPVTRLSKFFLEDSLERPLGQLSFGQQKIIENIAGLSVSPDVLLMDEPTAGLSATAKAETATLLNRWLTSNRTAVVAEHDIEFLSAVCDQIAVVSEGQISFQQFIRQHERPAVRPNTSYA
jgi:branched-chain amino acid transport system ATP-binding protein